MHKEKLLQTIFLIFIATLTIISLHAEAEEIKTIQAKEIWTIKNVGVFPFLSSDGTWVAWTDSVGRETRVYAAKIGTEEIIELGKTEELLGWLPGNNEYLMTAEGFISVKTKKNLKKIENVENRIIGRANLLIPINVNLNKIEKCYPFWVIQDGEVKKVYSSGEPYNFILFGDASKIKKVILFQNGVPIFVNTESENNLVFGFTPSPSQDKFILHLNVQAYSQEETKDHIVITKENKVHNLPYGTQFSWFPDGQRLIFARLKDDGHKETSGELFLCNWDGTNVTKIAFEEEKIRREPSFGSSGLITYNFYDENYNFCIGVAKISGVH